MNELHSLFASFQGILDPLVIIVIGFLRLLTQHVQHVQHVRKADL